MRASTYSQVSLAQFAQILGLDPLHFAGGYSALRPQDDCHDIWFQYQWQDYGKAAREEIARELAKAEEDIAELVGYWAATKWVADERYPLERWQQWPNLRELRLNTKWKHVISGGVQAEADIDDVVRGADIDTDGDGFAETAVFTVSNVLAAWGLEEVRACFKEYAALDAANCRTDPSSEGFDEVWEVRPLRLSRDGTTVTVYVPVWYLFSPQLDEALDAEFIDADAAGSYVDTLSFYRVYNDPSSQALFMWGTDCYNDTTCAWATQTGCIRTPDPRNGIIAVGPGTWDEDTDSYDYARWTQGVTPDAVRLWYQAGLASPAPGVVDRTMAYLICQLACARLSYPVCTCGNTALLIDEWRQNAAMATPTRQYTFTADMIANPLGMRVGEVLVYKNLEIPSRKVGKAVRT